MQHPGTARFDQFVDSPVSPVVREILLHLCESENPRYGSIVEWCESRGDCCQAVVCPECGAQYLLDDEEIDELRRISARTDQILSCGVVWD